MLKKILLSLIAATAALFLKSCEMPDGLKLGYYIENGEVVRYSGFPAQRRVVSAADARTFKPINKEYGKDSKQVFLREDPISGADPASFEYLDGSFSRDKNHGYSNGRPISDEGTRFNIVPNPNETDTNVTAEGIVYARDSRRVYTSSFVLEGADPASFEFVPMFNGNYLARDRKHVYWHDTPMEGIDGQSFVRLTEFHFKDKDGVWCLVLGRDVGWAPLQGADVATITGLKRVYAKDKNNVYYEDIIVKGADVATFEETENHNGKDKNRTYQSGKAM